MAWKKLRGAVLVGWLVASVALGAALLIRHLVPLPTPDVHDRVLGAALSELQPAAEWRAFHVMYRACPCSRRTIAHLLASDRPPQLRETVILVDDQGATAPEDALLRARFDVVVVTPEQLRTRFHLEAAPVLVVVQPDARVRYVGGYNRHKQSAAYEDAAIVAELRRDADAPVLPVFGCPTSERLARIVDPLNLAAL